VFQRVVTNMAHIMPYAYISGCCWKKATFVIDPATTLVVTRPRTIAPVNSKTAAICKQGTQLVACQGVSIVLARWRGILGGTYADCLAQSQGLGAD
jgi:hypothetical protein